jgi:uncharacterized membrane protein
MKRSQKHFTSLWLVLVIYALRGSSLAITSKLYLHTQIMLAQNTWIGSQTTMVANMATTASNTIPTEEQLFILSVALILRSPPARTQTECG